MKSTTPLSRYRQRLSQLLDKIAALSFQSANSDPLVQGSPAEVFRTCGRKTCKCATDVTKRHGPYTVIQIYQNKKSRQMAIRKDQKEIWQRAKNYQQQMNTLLELKRTCAELAGAVEKMITSRIEKWP